MKIGILSDTHNNQKNLLAALDQFRANGIHTLIHCGDMTSPETARALEGFKVICVLGNGDVASGEIRKVLLEQDPENYCGMVFKGRIGGSRIAAAHGHIPGIVDELVHSGEHDYVFTGHSHRHEDRKHNFTRLINPGALGGLHPEDRGVYILDLDSGKAVFLRIES